MIMIPEKISIRELAKYAKIENLCDMYYVYFFVFAPERDDWEAE